MLIDKKKILFVMPEMSGRGTQRSLLNLIKHIPADRYQIIILLCERTGELLNDIPDHVRTEDMGLDAETVRMINYGEDTGTKRAIASVLRKGRILLFFRILYEKLIEKSPVTKFTPVFDELPCYKEEVDIAVCYHLHNPFVVKFTANKVKAKKKAAWIHNDFLESGYDKSVVKMQKYLEKYDEFFAVSKKVLGEFRTIFPCYIDRSFLFYNYIDTDTIIKKADEFYPEEYTKEKDQGKCILLSVGSLVRQKGFDMAIECAEILKDKGIEYIWYLVGEGEEKEKLEAMINGKKLREQVKLTGYRDNPYPYFKNCDIYIQPSRHEGFCTAVSEAMALHKPVVATDVSGVSEQIKDGGSGKVVGFDASELADAVESLITDKARREVLCRNASIRQPHDELKLFLGEAT